jgi:Zn-dependent protease with chaperone function
MINQLSLLIAQTKLHSMKLFSLLLSFFLPISGIVIAIGFSIALDTITGIWKSVKKGESISSRRFSAFISKTMLYESTIMLFFLMDKFIINDIVIQLFSVPHLTTKAVGLVLISVELISINENYKGITGTDLWASAKNLLFRIKEVRKDIKDLK